MACLGQTIWLPMDALSTAIVTRNPEELINELLFEQAPFLFDRAWDTYRKWRLGLASQIDVDPSEIIVVGSAAIGRSLGPTKNLKDFDRASDVDIAIISDRFFSEAWHHLRTIDVTLATLTPAQKVAIADHQRRYIYWGCIATDRLLPLLPFAARWLTARSTLAAEAPTLERDVNFRLYKDFRALRGYQILGLKRLRATLLDTGGGADADVS